MKDKIELLAPAGGWEAFEAAVENGADAVYLGGRLFNARQYAGNFDSEELKRAIDYAHVRGVNVYLTMNTLLADSEMGQAADFAGEAYCMGIDGIIVQDLGFAGLLNKLFPGLKLHASTQMTIYNLEGVRMLEKLGFKRVVLARELPVDEIGYIAENTPLEIEIFIHGALCISYSGQCLMSSIIGGRSGNRGRCAQPCRLPYQLVNGRTGIKIKPEDDYFRRDATSQYLLSPKDFCSIQMLGEILNTGAKALKIEGRMKNPEYVATVVRIYRKYLDEVSGLTPEQRKQTLDISKEDMRDLKQIFNRGGFTTGYPGGRKGKDIMAFEKPKNWGIYLGEAMSYDEIGKRLSIKLKEKLSIGDGVEVWNGEDESPGTIVTEIKIKGKSVNTSSIGDIVSFGSIRGKIYRGNKVYKTSDKKLNIAARETFTGKNIRKVGLKGKIKIKELLPVEFTIEDNEGNRVSVAGCIPETAVNRPLTNERILEQINKTGGTPFEFSDIDVELDDNLALPVSNINSLRRRALEEMESKRISRYERCSRKSEVNVNTLLKNIFREGLEGTTGKKICSRMDYKEAGIKISTFFYKWDKDIFYEEFKDIKVDRVYLPVASIMDKKSAEMIAAWKDKEFELYLWLPPITRGSSDELLKSRLKDVAEYGVDGVLIANPAHIEYLKGVSTLNIVGDYSFNIFNSFSVGEMSKMGLSGITLSSEMTLSQINSLVKIPGLMKEAVVYGRIPLMWSEYCPVGSIAGGMVTGSKCSGPCKEIDYRLRDRKELEFPLLCDRMSCRSAILNSKVLLMNESLEKLKEAGVDMVRLYVYDETSEEVREIINLFKDEIDNSGGIIGKHNEVIEKIKKKGFTKGHYFRGV